MNKLTDLIYGYSRGEKNKMLVAIAPYKPGYHILTYVETKGDPNACLVAGVDKVTGKFYIGISAWNPGYIYSKGKQFKKQIARTAAKERLEYSEEKMRMFLTQIVPKHVYRAIVDFYRRCRKYYQNAEPAYNYMEMLGILTNEDVYRQRKTACEGSAVCGQQCGES